MQYAGRIGAAQIAADKNRWQFIGNDPQNPSIGRYMDKNAPPGAPSIVAGPPASGSGRSAQVPVAQWRYNAWLAVHHGDEAGALDYSAGHRTLSPQQMRSSALSLATRELGPGADPEDINQRAEEIYNTVAGGFEGEAPQPAPVPAAAPSAPGGGRGAAPHQNPPPPEYKQAPDGFFYKPDPARPGKYLKWVG